jgi:hypothetical protein
MYRINSAAIRTAGGRPDLKLPRRRWNWRKALCNLCAGIATAMVAIMVGIIVVAGVVGVR